MTPSTQVTVAARYDIRKTVMTDLRYPIGHETIPESITAEDRAAWMDAVAATPGALRAAVEGLSDEQLDNPYRDGGWTVRQVVHHVADSHMNAYIRAKLALTEDQPVIKPYDEARWAELADGRFENVSISLALLDALHERWVLLMQSLTELQWQRMLLHPERGPVRLDQQLASYEWHRPRIYAKTCRGPWR
jgi:hypothetical protein